MFGPVRSSARHVMRQLRRSHSVYVSSSSHLKAAAFTTIFQTNPTGNHIPYDGDFSQEKCDLRRHWVEQFTDTSLTNVSQWWKDGNKPDMLKTCMEMPIGLAKIPLAVAGPLQINGNFAKGLFLAPLAITEGAVVASAIRGAGALNKSGGVMAYTSQLRISGCPVFEADTPDDAHGLGEWVKIQRDLIQQDVVSEFSKHIILKEILCAYDLEFVHILLNYEADEATQPDIASSVSSQVAKWIAQKAPKSLKLTSYWRESHLSGEKKCSKLNMVLGHGLCCGAEAVIPEEVLKKDLGTSTESLMLYYQMLERCADRSLTMGSNGNTANITSAIFAATGQDLGNCVDASATKTQFTINEGQGGGVKYSLWIPSLVISSQHAACDLPAQRQCLELMQCYGPDKVRRLGEIIASFAIALDISTFSAMVEGQPVNN